MPLVDGYLWSSKDVSAGLRVVSEGKTLAIADPKVIRRGKSTLVIKGRTLVGRIRIVLKEDRIVVGIPFSKGKWELALNTDPAASLPFGAVSPKAMEASEYGFAYSVRLIKGRFAQSGDCVWKVLPSCGRVVFDTVQKR